MIIKDGLFSLEIVTEGKTRKEYEQDGDIFIIGSEGQPYLIRIKNYTDRRSVAVVNAEGLCIVDGLELGSEGIGYIMEPGQQVEIPDWHIRQANVAPLVFGELPSEEAAPFMDEPMNKGAIEAFFFYEQENPYYSADFLGQMALATIFIRGKGWGAKDRYELKREQFAKEESPIAHAEINYRNANTLREMKVLS